MDGTAGCDWRDLSYLDAFLDLTLSLDGIERRERVWIRRFLANRHNPLLDRHMDRILAAGHVDADAMPHSVYHHFSRGFERLLSSDTI